ncbi:MAG: GNAT family N-acetyltransferase [Clostridia bacterium]|nr:GNAT family N-acetyltransferase [Clostridia bacterium]
MKLKKRVQLKGGEEILLRSLCAADAGEALALCRRTAGETMFMSRYADEWTMTPEEEMQYIAKMECNPKALMLGAFVSGRLAGIASFVPPSPVDRARHRATLGICILKAHWGRGIGTAMLEALMDAAMETPLEQLELEVVSANERAIRLYERMGFVEFARHPRRLKYRDGYYADMVLMMLDLQRYRWKAAQKQADRKDMRKDEGKAAL